MVAMTPLFRVDTKRFSSPASLNLLWWGMVLRIALLAGYPVVLIGACRTGKTLLLDKLTPGKIIDKRKEAMSGQRAIVVASDEVPNRRFSVDECQLIESASICALASDMAKQKRAFCLAAQRYDSVKDAINTYRASEHAKRVVLVVVGGESNPGLILNELRDCERTREPINQLDALRDITPAGFEEIALENAKRDKSTWIFQHGGAPVYLINGEVVDKDRFKRESGLGHLVEMDDEILRRMH